MSTGAGIRQSTVVRSKDDARRRLDRESIADGVTELGKVDPVFTRLFAENGHPPLWQRPQTLRTLVHVVLEQKVSIVSALAVMERVDALCPRFDAASFLAVPEDHLRTAGMSGSKVSYCRSLAQAIADRTLSLAALRQLDDDAVMERLVAVRGIGPWTAGVYLTMALGRQDAWPSGDRALAVGYAKSWQLDDVPTYATLDAHAEAWRPWRGVASRLIWHAYLEQRRSR